MSTRRTAVRDTEIVERLVQGNLQREVAADHGLSRQRVTQIGQENRELIRQRQDELRLRAIERIDGDWEPMFDGLSESAKDPSNKNQPGAAKVIGELVGLTGKSANMHFGDNHLHLGKTTNVDARQIVIPETAEARDARLEVR